MGLGITLLTFPFLLLFTRLGPDKVRCRDSIIIPLDDGVVVVQLVVARSALGGSILATTGTTTNTEHPATVPVMAVKSSLDGPVVDTEGGEDKEDVHYVIK